MYFAERTQALHPGKNQHSFLPEINYAGIRQESRNKKEIRGSIQALTDFTTKSDSWTLPHPPSSQLCPLKLAPWVCIWIGTGTPELPAQAYEVLPRFCKQRRRMLRFIHKRCTQLKFFLTFY